MESIITLFKGSTQRTLFGRDKQKKRNRQFIYKDQLYILKPYTLLIQIDLNIKQK